MKFYYRQEQFTILPASSESSTCDVDSGVNSVDELCLSLVILFKSNLTLSEYSTRLSLIQESNSSPKKTVEITPGTRMQLARLKALPIQKIASLTQLLFAKIPAFAEQIIISNKDFHSGSWG